MEYTFKKVGEKQYLISFEHNGAMMEFNSVVAENETEIEGLVQSIIDYLNRDEAKYVRSYADKRRSEYPPVEDYLDGIVKNDQGQMQAYIDKCLAVKAKYPK